MPEPVYLLFHLFSLPGNEKQCLGFSALTQVIPLRGLEII
jgi:hypothetical protein